jgi:hypothetical protein
MISTWRRRGITSRWSGPAPPAAPRQVVRRRLVLVDTILSIVVVLIGAACIVFRAGFARLVVSTQNAAWGFRFGSREEIGSRILVVIVGLGFVTIGALTLLGLIHWKNGTR